MPDLHLATLRRKAGTAALLAFRSLPGPLKRRLVRVGTPNYTVGAVCVLEHDGEVLMLSQPHRRGWSLPGGLVEPGEAPADGVAREVREEVGLDIDPGDQVAVGFHPDSQSIDVIYRVVLDERPEISLSSEPRRFRWWDLDDLDDADRETRQIVALLRRAGQPPRPGRLLS